MKYLFALIAEEARWDDVTPEEMKTLLDRWSEYDRQAVENGVLIAGEALQPSGSATTVRVKAGEEPIVSDGPFAESKEQLGGFYLFEFRNLDEALEYAKRIPMRDGFVEVRPVMDFSEYGYESPTPGPVKAAV